MKNFFPIAAAFSFIAPFAVAEDPYTFSASNRPVSAEELAKGIDRGIEFLLEDQNKDGSWGSPRQTKGLNIYAPAPGAHGAFRTAVTALCISALFGIPAL